jgi:uncharacterized protein (TIGR02594 family)
MSAPADYAWLDRLSPLPRTVQEGLKLHGIAEVSGARNNPVIMAWADECGLEATYTADSVPWCGLFMAVVAKRAGKLPPSSPLWALSWAKFGEEAGQPRLGDVLTFVRPGGGHVGIYIGEDQASFHVLGGNQGDKVSIVRIAKERLYAARRPRYINRPPTVQPYVLAKRGALSFNEA